MRVWVPHLALLLAVSVASGNVYTVRNKNNSGLHSLRWAIERANTHPGPDQIGFALKLKGAVILPLSPLPTITDDETTIRGNIDRNSTPDIVIGGTKAVSATGGVVSGLVVRARRCVVRGLAIAGFSGDGIALSGARGCWVRGCYLGLNTTGRAIGALGRTGVNVWGSHGNTIGGTSASTRNVFAPSSNIGYGAILVYGSSNNTILGNYIGVTPNGEHLLGWTQYGVFINGLSAPADGNVIGGEVPGSGNVFSRCRTGALLEGATNSEIVGNLFGLKANGDELAAIGSACVLLGSGTTDTQIGGTTVGARNVFAGGAASAIEIRNPGTEDNRIQGNYFGTNRTGTTRRRLGDGIRIGEGAGWQLIGGTTPAAGNHFVAYNPDVPCDAIVVGGLLGSARIRNNTFGVLPAGGDAAGIQRAIIVYGGGTAHVFDNTIARAETRGLWVKGASSQAYVFGNLFRHCHQAVAITNDGTCWLGNLGNVNPDDDGGNDFRPSNDWTIWNTTVSGVKAEGNDFDTTSMAAIDAKIYDALDCPGAGRVDFIPLEGNVIPTGGTGVCLSLTGAAASPTGSGAAELSFSLSAPADVTMTILNIAGRPVATVARELAAEAGTHRLLWSGQTAHGTRAPAGKYLVRIVARGSEGARAQTLASLELQH